MVAYREAEEADGDFPETQTNLATVMSGAKRYREAAHHWRRAASLTPEQAANFTGQAEEMLVKADEEAKSRRQVERREEVNQRDGHLTKEQRRDRFQQVVSMCGMDKACMKRALNQEDAKEGDLIVF